jgi:glutathione S-transferase
VEMKLYMSKTSPYARRARVAIEELALAEFVEEIQVDPFNPPPELLAANPLSKVPTLVTERGEVVLDSSLIVDYLMTRRSGLALPPRGTKRWDVLRRAQVALGVIDAAVATVMERRRPESIVYTAFLDRQAVAIGRALDLLNSQAAELGQEPPGLAEINTGVALGYLDFRLPYIEWRTGRDALSGWFKQFAARPSMMKTQPSA